MACMEAMSEVRSYVPWFQSMGSGSKEEGLWVMPYSLTVIDQSSAFLETCKGCPVDQSGCVMNQCGGSFLVMVFNTSQFDIVLRVYAFLQIQDINIASDCSFHSDSRQRKGGHHSHSIYQKLHTFHCRWALPMPI